MSTRIRIDEMEEFPIPRYAGARRRRSRWHLAARWLLPALVLGIGLATYGLLAPHDPPSSAQEPRTTEPAATNPRPAAPSAPEAATTVSSLPEEEREIREEDATPKPAPPSAQEPIATEQRATNTSKTPARVWAKKFGLGMTRAEIWKIIQEEKLEVTRDGHVHISGSEVREISLTFTDGGTLYNPPGQRSITSTLMTVELQLTAHAGPEINRFKEFRLGMTRVEAQEVVQEWVIDQEWSINSNRMGVSYPCYPPDKPGYRGIQRFDFDFDDNGRLVKMVVRFTDDLDFQSAEVRGKFFRALEKKYGLPTTFTGSLQPLFGVLGNVVYEWESPDDDLRLTASAAPPTLGGIFLRFEHGVISRERAEKEALRQRTSDAIESLEIE